MTRWPLRLLYFSFDASNFCMLQIYSLGVWCIVVWAFSRDGFWFSKGMGRWAGWFVYLNFRPVDSWASGLSSGLSSRGWEWVTAFIYLAYLLWSGFRMSRTLFWRLCGASAAYTHLQALYLTFASCLSFPSCQERPYIGLSCLLWPLWWKSFWHDRL